jgi:hypothetical protein
MSDLIRLRGHRGQDEANCRGVSFKVSPWGTIRVPPEDVEPLTKIGGFYVAHEDDPSAVHSDLDSVREVAWHLPLGAQRDAILNFLSAHGAL